MPKKAAIKGGAEETTRLMVLMAERITQALARNPDLFRPGRGQMADFAKLYGLMTTTAKRILSGSAFPPNVLLLSLSEDVNVSVDWFYGRGNFDSIDDTLANANVEIPVMGSADGATIGVPPWALESFPEGAQLVAIAVDSGDFMPHLHAGDFALVELSSTPALTALNGVVFAGGEMPRLAYVTGSLRGNTYSVTTDRISAEAFASRQVSFGDADPPKDGLSVLGPVVGRVCFDRRRPILLPALDGMPKPLRTSPAKKKAPGAR